MHPGWRIAGRRRALQPLGRSRILHRRAQDPLWRSNEHCMGVLGRHRGVRKPCTDVLRSRFARYAAQTCINTAQLASYGLKAEVSGQTGVLPGRFLQRRAGLAKRHCVISGLEVNGNKKEIFRKIAPRHDSAGKYPSLPGTTSVCRELVENPLDPPLLGERAMNGIP